MADLGCGRVTQHTFPLKAAGPLPSNLLLHVGEGGESGMLGGGTASMWVLCSLPYSHIRAERMCVALALPLQPNTDMRAGAPPLWVNWRGRERISDREGREPAWELAGDGTGEAGGRGAGPQRAVSTAGGARALSRLPASSGACSGVSALCWRTGTLLLPRRPLPLDRCVS